MSFRKDFVWGSAAAAYQIEGAWNADGKGLSVWDMLTRQPGKIWEGHSGDLACDHYHLFKNDVRLMRELGLRSYRLSVSWPRVMPNGTGAVNEAGIGFYDRLVDELLAAGIDPWITLFHWDFPHELFLRGGWLNADSPKWFADYTAVVVDRLSDRVSHWITLNEPQCFIGMGHYTGEHAPGLKLGLSEVLLAAHHSLMAHGTSVQVLRARAKTKPVIGWAPVGHICYPVSNSPEDVSAARAATMTVNPGSLWNNTWWGDPPVLGHYPEEGLRAYGKAVPKFTSSDMALIHQPLDFYGVNIYSGAPTAACPEGSAVHDQLPAGHPHSLFLWKQTPEALYWGPKFLSERYNLPIVVTENGVSCHDSVSLDGQVHDPSRVDFLNRYLLALREAARDGVDVMGYFVWSILDNFEWAEGYKHRFGLVYVDYETQKRIPKDSAYWYREVMRSNGASLDRFEHLREESPDDLATVPTRVQPEFVAN